MAASDADHAWMGQALGLALTHLGTTAPNPTVGCVLVRDGQLIGSGVTQPGGRPHAEAVALSVAGDEVRGATAYVTLEPCAHTSPRGPDCSSSLMSAGVARVVVAMVDPDPRTAGNGIARLKAAGIAVEVGCREADAQALAQGFLMRLKTGRPLVAESTTGEGFETRFTLDQGESFEAALDRMGQAGFSRVWVPAGSPVVLALSGRGLLQKSAVEALIL